MDAVESKNIKCWFPDVETEGQSKQRNYPIVYVPLMEIGYRWEAPHMPEKYQAQIDKYRDWESLLTFNHTMDANPSFQRMLRVYDSLLRDGWHPDKPLILGETLGEHLGTRVPSSSTFNWCAVRGNVRLACIRALGRQGRLNHVHGVRSGMIPCRIKHPDDNWRDNTRAAQVHPWDENI